MEARALVLVLSAKRMRETPNKSANSAYTRPLPAVTTPQARTVPGLRLAGHAAVRVPEVARTATLLTTTATIRAASGGGQRLCRRPICKVAGGLVGRQRRRRKLSTLGAPMHFTRSAKPPGMMPKLRSLYNFYLIYFV